MSVSRFERVFYAARYRKSKKSDFFCVRDTFFLSLTKIFLNDRAKDSAFSLLLLHFSFLLPLVVVIRRRKKKNGRRRRVWWTKKTRVSFLPRIDEEEEEEENFVVVAPPTPSPHLLLLHFRRRRPFRRRPRAFDKKSITVVEIVFESFKPPPERFRSRTYLRSKSGRKHQRGILTRCVDRVEQSNVF